MSDPKPEYLPGDRVTHLPTGMVATVVEQVLHHDMGESFYGNLRLKSDENDYIFTANCWQCRKVAPSAGSET